MSRSQAMLSKIESRIIVGAKMKYRDAKKLHNEDQVIRKENGATLIVKSVEVFGQYKKVKLSCVEWKENGTGAYVSLFHDEIE
jgi:hypothetical protein